MTPNRGLVCATLLTLAVVVAAAAPDGDRWSTRQLEELRSLSLSQLEPAQPDPTNRVADDPRAAALGERLFSDAKLSGNGAVACSTCHQSDKSFQDSLALGRGVGTTSRRTMPVIATSRAPFLFWDGRKDSQWAQALGPLESAVEHGTTRAQVAHVIASDYRQDYETIFGPLPDLSQVPVNAGPVSSPAAIIAWTALSHAQRDAVTEVFVNVGKAIAAYERRLEFGPSRFDRYVEAVTANRPADGILTRGEVAGLQLFIGKANCTQCHNGPLLTNNEFHNTGVPRVPGLPVENGRLTGAAAVLLDEFNCKSRWSDARQRCPELEFLLTGEHSQERAYKVPSLRNVAHRGPYMDAGQFTTLAEVLDHYNRAPIAPGGHSELKPLHLKPGELRQLEVFLGTLSGPVTSHGAVSTSWAR
jgi:cytochrome c peroxidase